MKHLLMCLLITTSHVSFMLSLMLCNASVKVNLMLNHLFVSVYLKLVTVIFIPVGVLGDERQMRLDQICVFLDNAIDVFSYLN